eukprot:UN01707
MVRNITYWVSKRCTKIRALQRYQLYSHVMQK